MTPPARKKAKAPPRKPGRGGKRPGAGRKPKAVHLEAAAKSAGFILPDGSIKENIPDDELGLVVLRMLARSNVLVDPATKIVIPVPPTVRLQSSIYLVDRARGKPMQTTMHTGDPARPLVMNVPKEVAVPDGLIHATPPAKH